MGRPFKHLQLDFGYEELQCLNEESGRKYVTPEGAAYPSITTVLGALSKEGIEEWRKAVGEEEARRVSHHAATRGTALHNAVERYLNNEKYWFTANEMPHVKALFGSIQPVLDSKIGIIGCQETPLYSDTLGVAGRVDLIAEYEGVPSIIDFKTSKRRKTHTDIHSYYMQATAYAIMFEERTGHRIDDLVIIMAVDDDPKPLIFKEKKNRWKDQLHDAIQNYKNYVK